MDLIAELKFSAKLHYVATGNFRTSPLLLVEQQPIEKNQCLGKKIEMSDFQAR